jgi:hypothetical protein
MPCKHCGKTEPHYTLGCIPDEQVMVRRVDIETIVERIEPTSNQMKIAIDHLKQALK